MRCRPGSAASAGSVLAAAWLLAAGPVPAGEPLATDLAAAMLRASRSELAAGRAVARIEDSLHPRARQLIEAEGGEPARLLAVAGTSLVSRRVVWTFGGGAVRLEAVIDGDGPRQEIVYTWDGHAGVLFDRAQGYAAVRANRSLETEVWGVHPRSHGRPFFALGEGEAARVRQAFVDHGEETRDGHRLRRVGFRDPWQPRDHRLWLDPELAGLARYHEETFADSDRRVRTMTVERVHPLPGDALPLRVSEELVFVEREADGERFPLKLRRTVIEELEIPAEVPPDTFHQELPAGTQVTNEVLGLDYRLGERQLGEEEVLVLVAELERGEIAPPGAEPRARLGSGDAAFDVRCGVYSLFAAARLLGRPAESLRQVEKLTGFNHAGSHLAGLARGAAALGLEATGLATTPEAIAEGGWRGIAHLDGRHFVLLAAVEADAVVVLDVPASPRRLRREEFAERWDGVLLRLK